MVLPQGLVKDALTEVLDGPASALGRTITLKNIKPGFGDRGWLKLCIGTIAVV